MAGRGSGAGLAASSWATARTCSGKVAGQGWAAVAGAGAPGWAVASSARRFGRLGGRRGLVVGHFHAQIGLFPAWNGRKALLIQESFGGGPRRLGGSGFALGAARRVLEVGAQPADGAGGLLGGAAGVEGHQALQHRLGPDGARGLVRPGHGAEVAPAVGGQHGGVELVVQAAQHADQALLVQDLFLG
jgi:hypothetical protein